MTLMGSQALITISYFNKFKSLTFLILQLQGVQKKSLRANNSTTLV